MQMTMLRLYNQGSDSVVRESEVVPLNTQVSHINTRELQTTWPACARVETEGGMYEVRGGVPQPYSNTHPDI